MNDVRVFRSLTMPYGHVSRLEPDHGFGFLVDDSGLEWFFVRDGVRGKDFDALWLDQRVEFEAESTPRGPRAVEIRFAPRP
ncbi:MAG: cold-shock protein [Acidobacteriota bacterium]